MNKILLSAIGICALLSCDKDTEIATEQETIEKTGYAIVDTDVISFYDDSSIISAPSAGEPFYGQDANYLGNEASYTNNNDETILKNYLNVLFYLNALICYSMNKNNNLISPCK